MSDVIRIEKHTKNFVIINKNFLEDKRLSFKSKGILTYLLSKPDDWTVRVNELISASTDGEASVRSALKELEACGYYRKYRVRTEDGSKIARWESVIYEYPIETNSGATQQSNPSQKETEKSQEKSADLHCDFQQVGFPRVENHGLLSNNNLPSNNSTKDFNQTSTISSSSKDISKTARGRARTKTTGRATGKSSARKGYVAKARAIQKQIGYDQFTEEGADMELIDKIVEYLAGYYASPTALQRNGVPISEADALEYFDLLDHTMLAELIEKYEPIRCKMDVRNERSYILVMLYDLLKNPIFLKKQLDKPEGVC